jgi:transcriptional regulator CtsR
MALKVNKSISIEQQKKALIEEAWLKYYNQVLFEEGMITERERNLMINKIDARTTKSLSR